MKKHVVKLAFAAFPLLCLSLAYAAPRFPGTPTTPLGLTRLSESDLAARPAAGFKSQDQSSRAFVLGWNFQVCYQSRTVITGALSTIYVFNTDGSGFYFASANETATQHQLWAACQHGVAGYWINITNLTTLTYSEVAINYP